MWHLKHFICVHCDCQLGGKRYIVRNDLPYCVPCYHLATELRCNTCRKDIIADKPHITQVISYLKIEMFINYYRGIFIGTQTRDVFVAPYVKRIYLAKDTVSLIINFSVVSTFVPSFKNKNRKKLRDISIFRGLGHHHLFQQHPHLQA